MWYTVKRGDSLFSIARRYNTTVESIIALNNLSGTSLSVGQRLQIPQYTEVVVNVNNANIRRGPGLNNPVIANMSRGARLPVDAVFPGWYRVNLYNGNDGWISRDVVTFHTYGSQKPITGIVSFYTLSEGPALPGSYTSFANNTPYISQNAMFMWRISRDNPTQVEKFGQFTDDEVRTLVALAHRYNIKAVPVIHNLLYRPGGTEAGRQVVKQMVATPQSRRSFIGNVINLLQQFGFDGVNIDIEDVYREDSARISAFYTELGAALRRQGYFLSASVPSRVSDQPFNPFSDPFDYEAIGKAVDQFIVMLYNEHGWPGSGPGPVVSIGWMNRVLTYTISKMPAEKVVAAVSVFGFDFNLGTNRNTYVTYAMAVQLAQRYNTSIIWDDPTQTPMFRYTDAAGNKHEVWFENRYSILAKIRLGWQLGIAGIALWRLAMEDPAIWTMLATDVVVKKFANLP